MEPLAVDQIRLNFNPAMLHTLNAVIALMMFGVAIDMRAEDFRRVFRAPKGPVIGLCAQFVLLPALTFGLTLILPVAPSIALGMILVASCPGGNLSNLMTYLSGGNTALSVSMTSVSSVGAIVMTPLNLLVWGSLNPATASVLQDVSLRPWDVLGTILLILALPMVAGLTVSYFFEGLADRVRKPLKTISLTFFLIVVVFALKSNWGYFVDYVGGIFFVVVAHNALALGVGYGSARLFKLPERDCRAVCIEVGIQNSALALALIFEFFAGLGGMAIIAGLWGIWHIVSGLSVALFFSRRALPPEGVVP